MKKVIATTLLALVLAVVTLPAIPALAFPAGVPPVINLSPAQGEPGTRLYVTGINFQPGLTFNTYFARGQPYESARNATVAANGTVFDTFPVPEVPAGLVTVAVETSFNETAWATFKVLPVLRVDKTSALVGASVIVSGAGFKANSAIALDLEGTTIGTASTGPNGSFGSTTITVPDATRGTHLITGTDSDNNQAMTRLAVLNSITVSPSSGPMGTTVTVKGGGFVASQSVLIKYDGAAMSTTPATVLTSPAGAFSATFVVPARPGRTHEIEASDGLNVSSATFTTLGVVTVTPNSGNVGTQVTVRGTGFAGTKAVTVRFDAAQVGTATTDASGGFSASFNVPTAPSGAHTVTASDGTDSAIATFTTNAVAAIRPTSGPVGAEVEVTGNGLAASKPATVAFGNTQVKSAATDPNGSLSDKFTVPRVKSGSYPVTLSDGVNTANFNFTVVSSASLNRTNGDIGSSLTVSGTGFSGTVTVKYDDRVVATTTTDAGGAFFVSFSVPQSVRGNHVISASDGVNTMQTTFAVESTPPQPPVLTLPIRDTDAKGDIRFDWSDVTDPSQPVTFTLQVATSRDFTPSSMVLERKGLTVSEYALAKDEQLKPASKEASYYWRVRAIDAASNESDWSGASSFYITTFPDVLKYVLIGLGVLVVALLIFWLGRRTKSPF